MELELGLKITRTRDDDDDDRCSSSVSELRIAKDRAGPTFLSKETHALFILTAHLKGYKRNNIEIKISEDGKEISISGEKPIHEMMMMGWAMMKNQDEISEFRKVFKIPNGVVLDWIKAKYNEDESILKIVMPKVVKGIYGVQIEEVKEEEYGESSQKASGIGENESILEKEGGLSNKKLLEATNGDIIEEKSQKEIEKPRFETGKGFEAIGKSEEDHYIPKNIGETTQKILKEPIIQLQQSEDRNNVMPTGEIGETKAKEIETEDREEERIVNKEELETIMETTLHEREYESVLATSFGANEDEVVQERTQRETKVPKFKIEDRESVAGEEIRKEGVEAKEISMKEQVLIEDNQIEEAQFEIEDGDRKSVAGDEISKEGVEEIETEMRKQVPKAPILLRESGNVLAMANEFSGEDMKGENRKKQIKEPKFETDYRNRERVVGDEICKKGVEEIETGTRKQVLKAPILLEESKNVLARANGFSEKDMHREKKQKQIEEPKFDIAEKKIESVVGEEIRKEGVLKGTETKMKEQVLKELALLGEPKNEFARAIRSNEEDINGETKQKELEESMFETKDSDRESVVEEEICKEGVEEMETEIIGQVPKESSLLGESKVVQATKIGFSGEDINGETKKETEEPKFENEDKHRESLVVEEISKEGVEGTKTKMEEKVSKALALLGASENVFAREIGSNGEDTNGKTKQKEIEEPKFETKDKDRESMVEEEICKEGVDEMETKMNGHQTKASSQLGESENVLASAIGFSGEGINGETKQKEIEEPRFETEDKNRESVVGEEINKEGVEGTKSEMKKQISQAPALFGEFENVFARAIGSNREEMNEETKQKEIEEPKFGTKGKDRESMVEEEICKEGGEEMETEMNEQVPKTTSLLGESKNVQVTKTGFSGEDINGETKQKDPEEPKFENDDKNKESLVGKEITKERVEEGAKTGIKEKASKALAQLGESENVFAREIESNGEDMYGGEKKQNEIEEPKFETKDRDRGSLVEEEICKEGVEERETEMKEHVPKVSSILGKQKLVLAKAVGFSGEDMNGETNQKGTKEPKFDGEDKNRESMLGEEISKEKVEGTKTEMKERVSEAPTLLGESKNVFARVIGSNGETKVTKPKEIEEPKFQTKDRNRESMVEEGICMEGVKDIDTEMKEQVPKESSLLGDYKNMMAKVIGFSGDDKNGETKQKENEEPKFQTEDIDRESMAREEISKEGVNEIKTEMKEQVPKVPILLGESTNVLAMSIGLSGKEMNGGAKQKETKEPKFGMEYRYNEWMGTKGGNSIIGAGKQKEIEEPKFKTKDKYEERVIEDIRMEGFEAMDHSGSTVESMEGGEDINRVTKQREIEESELEIFKEEENMIPKSTKAKVEEAEEIKGVKEVLEKRDNQKTIGFMEKIEGEPKKMNEEMSKILDKDYTKEVGQKGFEGNIFKKVFEVLGTIIAEFPEHMVETKAKREREVKVKGEVVIKMHDEAKAGVHKDIFGDKVHMEIGQPSIGFIDSDKGEFHVKNTFEVLKKDETKAIKQDSTEKVKGEHRKKLQVEADGGFQKDKIRERTQEKIEEPGVGTKHKDQQCIQEELTMQMEGSLAKRKEGPKDTKIEKLKILVLEKDESMMNGENQEMNIEKACKKEKITKALQEAVEEKDQEALKKGINEREKSGQLTQQSEAKENGKACEDCKLLEATLEIEKHRATEKIKDEKPRTRKEVQHVAETMQKTPEKRHLKNFKEPEREQEPLEENVAYSTVTKKFEPKNDVEHPKLKELSPPKVEIEAKESLELQSKSMKLTFQKAQKHVPEAKEKEEEHKAAKRSQQKSSSSAQQSMVEEKGKSNEEIDKRKSKIDFLEVNERWIPLPDRNKEALPLNILVDQSFKEKKFFKTLNENKGQQYMPENFDEKGFETRKNSNEEKLSQKDQAEIVPCKSKGKRIAKSDDEEKFQVHGKTQKLEGVGDQKIDEIKQISGEFKEALKDSETESSQKELLLPQMEIRREEEIPTIRTGQQEKSEIPFHANEILDSEVVPPKREVNPLKATDTHVEATRIEFGKDEPEGEVDKLKRKIQSSPSSKKPSVKQHAPKIEIVPQLQEVKESMNPVKGTKALEVISNEVEKPSIDEVDVEEKGKIDECCEDVHLEIQELEKEESELDFQESTKRRFDLEVGKIRSMKQEESYIEHEIEEDCDDEEEEEEEEKEEEEEEEEEGDEVEVENTQELEVLEDIEVEESEDKKKVRTPLVIVGSAFFASLIVFFVRHRRVGKRYNVFDKI